MVNRELRCMLMLVPSTRVCMLWGDGTKWQHVVDANRNAQVCMMLLNYPLLLNYLLLLNYPLLNYSLLLKYPPRCSSVRGLVSAEADVQEY